ncbi:MAG: VOC family protein [Rhodococcus sp. (in: high G+C Gram-positive bacteria)]|nr:VOC family protein [Rhodococcus sp. (in: high G+C Gram-positive bacteria)]
MLDKVGNALGHTLSNAHQLAYSTTNFTDAIAHADSALGLTSMRRLDLELILDVDKDPYSVGVTAAFADSAGRQIEIFRLDAGSAHCPLLPMTDSTEPLLRFHHVGAFVSDLDAVLRSAHEVGLTAVQGTVPGMLDVAFIDLRPTLGHWLECLQKTSRRPNI